MKLLEKLLCLHDWRSHEKRVYKWEQTEVVAGTESWFKPKLETYEYSSTTEVLICNKCGKIKQIEY